jgi:hypothetical protein
MATAKKDISQMTVEEIDAYLKERKENEMMEIWGKAVKAKEELEKYCQDKYGLTLAQVYGERDG